MTVSVQYAAEHLEDVLSALSSGEAVEIARPGETTLRLTASEVEGVVAQSLQPRILGAGRGELRVPSDEEWEQMDKEWRKSFDEKFGLEA